MIYTVLRTVPNEAKILERELREEAAYSTEEALTIVWLEGSVQVTDFLEREDPADILYVDVAGAGGIESAKRLRQHCPTALLVILADLGMSPTAYLRPDIMASSLMLRPLRADKIREVFRELLECLVKVPEEEIFLVETREEKQRIPYRTIRYFEAREKKVYVCTADREYGFYDTMDHLEEQLPEGFLRCHRSYVVNRDYVTAVRLSANLLELEDGITIPLSRSYKERFREFK